MAKSTKSIQPPKPPKGTRDLYPDDLLKRRYIQNAWRDASLRCGFDEIEGPTFESTDLYSIKSGQGILNELFQTFSGKGGQETLDKLVERGQADFALRPEFTPTLARMYAARAKQLPKPCKWFTAGPYFRAERPQRGRLREFLQWNVDFISDDGSESSRINAEVETIDCCTNLFEILGFQHSDIRLMVGDRGMHEGIAKSIGVSADAMDNYFAWLDGMSKRKPEENQQLLNKYGLPADCYDRLVALEKSALEKQTDGPKTSKKLGIDDAVAQSHLLLIKALLDFGLLWPSMEDGRPSFNSAWCQPFSLSIVRGLAYYTGTVFEAIADGERAVAGGGRYDNLIELMGGPPTPAVGFAMGDVVLGNLLDDKHLMPEGQDLMEAVSRKQTSIRPEAFIAVPNNDEENKSAAQSLTAALRRGQESETYLNNENKKPWQADRYRIAPIHTRISYKSTTNPGKLRKDAEKQHAKYFIEIHAPNKVELTNMDKRESITSPTHGSFSINPTDENYIGTALANLA